jgi:hypothetical protein
MARQKIAEYMAYLKEEEDIEMKELAIKEIATIIVFDYTKGNFPDDSTRQLLEHTYEKLTGYDLYKRYLIEQNATMCRLAFRWVLTPQLLQEQIQLLNHVMNDSDETLVDETHLSTNSPIRRPFPSRLLPSTILIPLSSDQATREHLDSHGFCIVDIGMKNSERICDHRRKFRQVLFTCSQTDVPDDSVGWIPLDAPLSEATSTATYSYTDKRRFQRPLTPTEDEKLKTKTSLQAQITRVLGPSFYCREGHMLINENNAHIQQWHRDIRSDSPLFGIGNKTNDPHCCVIPVEGSSLLYILDQSTNRPIHGLLHKGRALIFHASLVHAGSDGLHPRAHYYVTTTASVHGSYADTTEFCDVAEELDSI